MVEEACSRKQPRLWTALSAKATFHLKPLGGSRTVPFQISVLELLKPLSAVETQLLKILVTADIGYCDYHLVTNIGYCDYFTNPRLIQNAILVTFSP